MNNTSKVNSKCNSKNNEHSFLLISCIKSFFTSSKPQYGYFYYDTQKNFIVQKFVTNVKGTLIENIKYPLQSQSQSQFQLKENELIPININANSNCISQHNEFLLYNITFQKDLYNNFIIHCNSSLYIPVHLYHNELKSDQIELNEDSESESESYMQSEESYDENEWKNLQIGAEIKLGAIVLTMEWAKVLFFDKVNIRKYTIQNNQNKNKICKLCKMNSNNHNRIIQICKCESDERKYAHIKCFKKWVDENIFSKVTIINNIVTSLSLIRYYCNKCNQPYPIACRLSETKFIYFFNILDIPKQYIIFKVTNLEEEKDKLYFCEYLLIEYNKIKEISIGNSVNDNVRIEHYSISKHHCYIKFDEYSHKFKIRAGTSEFGTLVKMTDDIILNNTNPFVYIQKGCTLYRFSYFNDTL